MIHFIATVRIKPGTKDDVVALARPCIEATRNEAGNISYDLTQSMTDPETMIFVERWKDAAAVASHFKEPHFQTFQKAVMAHVTDVKMEQVADGTVTHL